MIFKSNPIFSAVFLTCAIAASSSASSRPREPGRFRLALDDRLTTAHVLQIENVGRCVALEDFSQFTGMRTDDLEATKKDGKSYVPIGYLCLRLGLAAEIDPSYGFVRIKTNEAAMGSAAFLAQWSGRLEAERALEAMRRGEISRGLLAVGDRVLSKAFTLKVGQTLFAPLEATLEALGAKDSLNLQTDPTPLRHRRFVLSTLHPEMDYLDEKFIDILFFGQKYGIQTRLLENPNDARLLDPSASATISDAELFRPTPALERLRTAAEKLERCLFKTAYLTFDDGPSQTVTPIVLDTLKAYQAPATFFVLGKEAALRPELLRRLKQEGHVVGNHSYTHIRKNLYTNVEGFLEEIEKTNDVFEKTLSERTQMIRAPYGTAGYFKPDYYERLHAEGYKIYSWNIDSGDSSSLKITASQIAENVRLAVAGINDAVILFHDASSKMETAKALPGIIEMLREMDYEIKPLDYDTVIRYRGVVK